MSLFIGWSKDAIPTREPVVYLHFTRAAHPISRKSPARWLPRPGSPEGVSAAGFDPALWLRTSCAPRHMHASCRIVCTRLVATSPSTATVKRGGTAVTKTATVACLFRIYIDGSGARKLLPPYTIYHLVYNRNPSQSCAVARQHSPSSRNPPLRRPSSEFRRWLAWGSAFASLLCLASQSCPPWDYPPSVFCFVVFARR
ncbi:hypothetical protein BT67DRAFT_183057 [Trichocladium antarcticum]|uniref:Uncharacterized protein n=1 Tax=Trichocladium antarcticum TaxID=1450529 RepID=A0AAN6ZFK9_9PEZI|nr:hypothetical protein BT67DRAFT_183057 [Trichocladium antarcticum]